jgi:hypothetical protein
MVGQTGGHVRAEHPRGRGVSHPGAHSYTRALPRFALPFPPGSVFCTTRPSKKIKRWLETSIAMQWDYKKILTRKGGLERLK